jgi:hypothetical protein
MVYDSGGTTTRTMATTHTVTITVLRKYRPKPVEKSST